MFSTLNRHFLHRFTPFMAWLPGISREEIKCDVGAGLTGAIIVLPQGVAFATIAGMPPEYGLYAGMIPAIVAAFFGSSRHLVSGPTTAASIVMFSSLSVLAVPGTMDYVSLALTLAFMVGVIQLILGFARMGAVVNFISHSVIVGFTAGAAVLIAGKQLENFFGVDIPRGAHLHEIAVSFYRQLPDINLYITTVGLLTLLSGLAIKRWWPRVPFMIVAMLIGGVSAALLNLLFGQSMTGIKIVGALPSSLPPPDGTRSELNGDSRPGTGGIGDDFVCAHRSGLDRPLAGDPFRASHRQQPGVYRSGLVQYCRQFF